MATHFKLDAGFPTFSINSDAVTAVRAGRLPWGELDDFIAEMYPPSLVAGGVQTIQYGASFPGRPYLRVTDIQAKPFTDRTTEIDTNLDYKHEEWYITLTYQFIKNLPLPTSSGSSNNDPQDPVPFLIHRGSIGTEVIQVDNQGLAWDNISKFGTADATLNSLFQEENGVGKLVSTPVGQELKNGPRMFVNIIEHEMTWQRVPRPPFTAIRNCGQAPLNDREMVFRTGKIPKECLKFNGAGFQLTTMTNGQSSWELVYKFSERRVKAEDQSAVGGWNHFYRSKMPDRLTLSPIGGGPALNICTGMPGFYRMKKYYGKSDNDCLPQPLGDSLYKRGYDPATAIFLQSDQRKLFQPEPIV